MNVGEEFSKFKIWLLEHKDDYQSILAEKPYCIETKTDLVFGRDLVIFKYNQIDSDFKQPFVKLCRGLVLDAHTFEPVVFPFVKFHNAGEPYADDINWKSCWVTEKLDGSIIKIVRLGNDVLIGTNSNIDAFKAPLVEQIGCTAKSFGELAIDALLANDKLKYEHLYVDMFDKYAHPDVNSCLNALKDLLDEGKTYIFELTSPYNKIVVWWKETRLNFLGVRDNNTLQETCFCDHELKNYFNTPKIFPLKSVDDCIKAAEQLDCNSEGFVVCDKNFNRIKVKSPLYVAIHHLRGENGVMSYRRALEIVKKNEVEEVLAYFPEYRSAFDDLSNKFNNKVKELETVWNEFVYNKNSLSTRKDQALWLTSHCKTCGLLFAMLDRKILSIYDGLYNMSNENILKMLGYKDSK